MRNRILFITRNSIPYVKELQPLTGSIAGCILMQQLDYWFEKYSDGFYKFLRPCEGHTNYKQGSSWCEELGMTRHEFHTAFDRIGVRYTSKGNYDKAEDKFAGKYYCSYQDRARNLTFYYRNHQVIDRALDTLIQNTAIHQAATPESGFTGKPESGFTGKPESGFTGKPESGFTGKPESGFTGKPESGFTGKPDSGLTEIHNLALQESRNPDSLYTEITDTEITKKPLLLLTDPAQPADTASSSGISQLKIPQDLSPIEKDAIVGMILNQEIPTLVKQEILDELAGAMQTRAIKRGAVPFTFGLITAFNSGRFTPSLGIKVMAQRESARVSALNEKVIQSKFMEDFRTSPEFQKKGEEKLAEIRAAAKKRTTNNTQSMEK